MLLAGLGNTAHVYDEFAPKLADACHIYGITRRGHGSSSHPESGYTAARLAEDVRVVLDAIQVTDPVLLGHSYGGEELTALATRYPTRVAGLVYLDGAADRTRLRRRSPTRLSGNSGKTSPRKACQR